jgi:hypothetical protein
MTIHVKQPDLEATVRHLAYTVDHLIAMVDVIERRTTRQDTLKHTYLIAALREFHKALAALPAAPAPAP